jgi:uncharacterized membrane-anchored protein
MKTAQETPCNCVKAPCGCNFTKELTKPPKQVGLTRNEKMIAIVGMAIIAFVFIFSKNK